MTTDGSSARIAWFEELGAQAERNRPAPAPSLPAPDGVVARSGRGQVTVDWWPVDGAAGYLVHRAAARHGPWQAIDHRAGDVLAVPHPPYADTSGMPGTVAWYAVAALPSIDAPVGPLSVPVESVPDTGGDGRLSVVIDAAVAVGPIERPWRPIIGSEHLALLLRGEGPGGHHVGDELSEAFRIVRVELGVQMVRAHAIFHDSLGVYHERNGQPIHDFERVDAVLERLLGTRLRPVVELSFMPRDLASDPERTVFDYRGIISPPRDMARWSDLVAGFVHHVIDRFGRDEVRSWAFEVWNEPNLGVFWSADEDAYFDLYDASVRAVRSVDPSLRVGGPATAAVGWVDDLLAHTVDVHMPLDFLSTHTYGLPPLDLRPIAARFGRPDLPLWWTEWGVSPTHGSAINDSAWAAPLVARGMRSAAGRLESLAYWVASDHFVELGEAERLFHGGFGLLTIGNLRKPRFWVIAMLERLGEYELASDIDGDGAGSLVEAWASGDPDGRVAIAIWNGTLDQTDAAGNLALDRSINLEVAGLRPGNYELRHHRVDESHSNIVRTWEQLGRPDWPDDAGWTTLHAADRLETLDPPHPVRSNGGRIKLDFTLPMPAVSLIELVPIGDPRERVGHR